ncbi:hypothetical protein FCM35_KLT11710 [Carex littledalei]|uniref:Uncharacterized protein n=1 Tax=Carex littledalei TaxID=544730 RepID=A0A833QIP1_9POAL|nr:hypothetical protein FCM35_KLT11710 [Carex littledalei]
MKNFRGSMDTASSNTNGTNTSSISGGPKNNESGPKFYPERDNSCDRDRFTGFDYIWEHNHETFWNNFAVNYSVNDPKCMDELAKGNSVQGEKFDCSEDNEKLTSSLSFKFENPKVTLYPIKEEESPDFSEKSISHKPPISNESPTSANIQKYQIVPERNLRGFVQQPETMTISIREHYTELKAEKLSRKKEKRNIILEEQMVGEIEKLEPIIEPEPKSDVMPKPECESELRIEPESQPENEVGMDLERESLPELNPECEPAQVVKHEPKSESESESEPEPEPKPEPEPEPEPDPVDGIISYIDKKRDLSEGFGRESWSENKPEYTNYKETNKPTDLGTDMLSSTDDVITESMRKITDRGFNPVNEPIESENIPSDPEIPLEIPRRLSKKPAPLPNRRKLVRRKRSIQKEMILEKPELSSSSSPSTVSSERGRQMLTRRYVSEEFSSFDSDSQSSVSDGYSVKDLIVDSDSDWFLSEKESDSSPHKIYSAEQSTNLVRYTSKPMDRLKENEKGQAQSFYGSETDSSNLPAQISSNHDQPDEVNAWLENNSKPEFDVQNQEEKAETVVNDTQMAILSQEDEATSENLDRETETDTLNQYETMSPRKDYATEKPTQDSENIDIQQSKSKDKGKEYLDEEEEDELESLWEHQDLIEQLKMEIKKARAVGLPTILEESETPKTTMEELKTWHFDEKFLHEDPMDELNKFYKSYRERMRKFDILNYQKMYAVGFLQLKNPLESMGSQKPLIPTITSILSQNLSRRRKSTDDPSERFIKELRCDLEMVYVGQLCLSWEILRWQYEKALEMPESDPYHSHRYNQAAGEFQQFQVLVNRFIENEPFQIPRLPNYVKNRCVLRNLLQVPLIKEDNLREKREDDQKGNYIITSEELEDIMEESIRVFWEFVKADKNEMPVILKGLVGPQVELQDPSDYDFMMHLHSILQKKEKRLKDLLKTGNCLVKKFKKPKEDRSNLDLFFSQVDIKLVSRVLKMPKLSSEQLQWCHKKLDKISFVDRKIQREPSFLLFPC